MMLHPGLMGLTNGVRGRITLCVVLGLAAAGASIWQGVLMARVIATVLTGSATDTLWIDFVWIAGLVLARAGLLWARRLAELATGARVRSTLRDRLFGRLLDLGPGYMAKRKTGEIQATLVDGVEALEGYFGSYVPQFFVTLLIPTGVLIYVFTIDWMVGLLILAAVLTALFAPKLWERMLGSYGADHWSDYGELNTRFVDAMQGMTTLKAFNAARSTGASLAERAHALYKSTMIQLAISMMSTGIVGLAMRGGSAMALVLGVVRLSQGAITLPELFILLFLAGECVRPLADLDRAWHTGFMGISAASGMFGILRAEPDVTNPAKPTPLPDNPAPAVTFEQVTFAYEPDRPALHELSFELPSGSRLALVGASGSGKSTVVSLLLRFFDPQQGRILIDGVDLRDLSLDDLRARIAVVSQDTYLFHGTVAENLRLSRPDASDEALEAAARAANAHQFISALPQGYDTPLGERGQNLSGGERQRLAIARAILKDAPLLILDEATANLDSANEADIQTALEQLSRDRTTLVIAHRPSAIRTATDLITLEEGRRVPNQEALVGGAS